MELQTQKSNQNFSDELFCISYEMNAMADLLIRKETERWVSGFANIEVEEEHHARYKWITNYVENKRVLDIACGSGKGSYMIAKDGHALDVIGCDLDGAAIKYASIKYKDPKICFINKDAQIFTDEKKFDIIVSFETIEHIPDVDSFLKTINMLLAENGNFYVSTPISKKGLDKNPDNPYHIQEWSLKEFEHLISKYFVIEETFLQMREENIPLIYYWVLIKQKIQYLFKKNMILNFKGKYLNKNSMKPIKYDSADGTSFQNFYGIVGLQILKVKKK